MPHFSNNGSPLSVCKGLVFDRMQRLVHGTSVLPGNLCRASYGILCNRIWNKSEHRAREPYNDPIDGKKYASDCIEWFVFQGEIVTEAASILIDRTRTASFN